MRRYLAALVFAPLAAIPWAPRRVAAIVPAFSASFSTDATQTPGNCTDSNVAAYLSMDNASGNLTVPSGCAASGTVFTASGSPTYSAAAPRGLGTAIKFNGTTDYFAASGDIAALDPLTSSMVLEAWINTTNAATTNTIAAKFNNTDTGWLFDQSTTARFWLSDGTTTCSVTSATAMGDGAWHYVRATWNGTNICTIATDGGTPQSATQAVGSVDIATAPTIGARQNTSSKWVGSIADLRITVGNSTNSLGYVANPTPEKGPAPTFTRATTSTRWGSGSGISTVAGGSVVIGCPEPSNGAPASNCTQGIYVGQSTTFLTKNNENLTAGGGWSVNACATVTADTTDVTAPDGSNNAEKYAYAGCSDVNGPESAPMAVTGSLTNTYTVWVRGAAGGEQIVMAIFDSSYHRTTITLTNTWKRYTVSLAADASASNYVSLRGISATTATFYVWRPEYYQKAFPVPLDPAVAGAAVTVNADALSYTTNLDATAMTVVSWENIDGVAGTYGSAFELLGSGFTNINYDYNNTDGLGRWYVNGSTNCNNSRTTTPASGTWHQHSVTFTSGAQWTYLDAAKAGTVCAVSYTPGIATTLRIGARTAVSSLTGTAHHAGFRIYTRILSDSQILALYNASSGSYAQAPKNPLRDWLLAALPAFVADRLAPSNDQVVAAARWRVAHDPALAAAWTMPEVQ